VAGIIGAEENNATGGAGIAPDVKLVPIQFIDSDSTDLNLVWRNVASAINYAVAIGARVINMSIGYLTVYISSAVVTEVQTAINAAHAAGVVVVAAAGNDAANVANYMPASFDNVITVSATNSSDSRATYSGSYFSNYGSAIDFSAPGANIYSAYWTSTNPNGYSYEYGTSMAAPFVTGLAAMIFAQDPTATPDDVFRRLKFSSKDLGTTGWDQYYGYGRIDAFKALSYDYYDNGTIKTQWLETTDENGWNRLSFDTDGYMTGGAYVGAYGLAGLGAALVNAIAPVLHTSVQEAVAVAKVSRTELLPFSPVPVLKAKKLLRMREPDRRAAQVHNQSKKAKTEDVPVISKVTTVLSSDEKGSNRSQRSSVKARKKIFAKERVPFRTETSKQNLISELAKESLVLTNVCGGSFAGTAFCMIGAESIPGQG
jgi:hypothetical protein